MNRLFLTTIAFFIFVAVFADDKPNTKFGKPTSEEMTLTACPFDPDAPAMFLSKCADCYYFYQQDVGFQVKYEYKYRIKVLKEDGVEWGDVDFTYHNTGDIRDRNEKVDGISATSYNLENGKTIKAKLENKDIFHERVSDRTKRVKFSVPNVKVGTVIEYKYTITSEIMSELRSWYAQSSIPVLYSHFELNIPEFFDFKYDIRGPHPLNVKRDVGVMSIPYGIGQAENIRSFKIEFEGNKAPSMKDVPYLWCVDDFLSHVDFTLTQVNFFGRIQNLAQTWRDVDDLLFNKSDQSGFLKMKNPFKDEMASLQLDECKTNAEKVARIMVFVSKKIKWNREYSLFATDVKKSVSNGEGNNVTINYILMSMMRDVGIDCKPVLLSTRGNGRILYNPSLEVVDTFIVGFTDTDGSFHYIDASAVNGYIDVMPLQLHTDFVHVVGSTFPKDLSRLTKNVDRTNIECAIDNEGLISGTITTNLSGQESRRFKSLFASKTDSTEFIKDIELANRIKIKSLDVRDLHIFGNDVRYTISFEKQIEPSGDMFYVNSLIIPSIEENPFKQENRDLPIEMDFTKQHNFIVSLLLPETMEVVESPQPSKVSMQSFPKNVCTYRISSESGKVVTNYKFTLDNVVFPASAYSEIKAFWAKVVEYNENMIVIKKK
ncbi:MAG: DUF3857 domain-containing protein [Muribaculaceae bacterium]|nr:DUF3857 domain-containing protein [Muribaculaceae bacterium]